MREQNLDIYGHGPIPWSRALKQLGALAREEGPGGTCWLATTDSDGRPHLAAVAPPVDPAGPEPGPHRGPRVRRARQPAAGQETRPSS